MICQADLSEPPGAASIVDATHALDAFTRASLALK
jgi:hypothetical protein